MWLEDLSPQQEGRGLSCPRPGALGAGCCRSPRPSGLRTMTRPADLTLPPSPQRRPRGPGESVRRQLDTATRPRSAKCTGRPFLTSCPNEPDAGSRRQAAHLPCHPNREGDGGPSSQVDGTHGRPCLPQTPCRHDGSYFSEAGSVTRGSRQCHHGPSRLHGQSSPRRVDGQRSPQAVQDRPSLD